MNRLRSEILILSTLALAFIMIAIVFMGCESEAQTAVSMRVSLPGTGSIYHQGSNYSRANWLQGKKISYGAEKNECLGRIHSQLKEMKKSEAYKSFAQNLEEFARDNWWYWGMGKEPSANLMVDPLLEIINVKSGDSNDLSDDVFAVSSFVPRIFDLNDDEDAEQEFIFAEIMQSDRTEHCQFNYERYFEQFEDEILSLSQKQIKKRKEKELEEVFMSQPMGYYQYYGIDRSKSIKDAKKRTWDKNKKPKT